MAVQLGKWQKNNKKLDINEGFLSIVLQEKVPFNLSAPLLEGH